MAETTARKVTFVVPGVEEPAGGPSRGGAREGGGAGEAAVGGRVKQAVRVGVGRGSGGAVRLEAVPGEDVVRLHLANGPTLVLHPESARDLLLAQGGGEAAGASRGAPTTAPGEVPVALDLRWGGGLTPGAASRGGETRGGVQISVVDVVTDLVTGPAADLAAGKLATWFDGKKPNGVFAPTRDALPGPPAPVGSDGRIDMPTDAGPLLVLVHGTFSSTVGTFSKLWQKHGELVGRLLDGYQGRVLALDHPTLGASPIENALALARTLPANARLHVVTHSRGGLVAEVLARVCAAPLTDRDLDYFRKDDFADQLRDLRELDTIVRDRKVTVERVVRVAATARGTLLASRRLDAYVSVLEWTLRLAGVPVAPELIDFLGAVAKRRANPELMPGLQAQMPGSPLVRWLNEAPGPIPGELRVVAGDAAADSIGSWVKTLAADAFFWTDNDFVVQTRSMYGAGARGQRGTFVLDTGGKVSHFNYFNNDGTAAAIVDALVEPEPRGFRVIGPLSQAGKSSTGVRAAPRAAGGAADAAGAARERPALLLVPGFLGSSLQRAGSGERVWPTRALAGDERASAQLDLREDGLEADGLLEVQYGALTDFLARTHEVIPVPYDWRRPLEESAARLAAALRTAMDGRAANQQPVRILAHELGGLVVRTTALAHPDVWGRFVSRAGSRALFLGTPNAGCWTPMQVVSGDDTFGGVLEGLDAPLRDDRTRQALAECVGLLQMQAGLRVPELGLAQAATWRQLADDDLARVRALSRWHRDWTREAAAAADGASSGEESEQVQGLAWGVPTQPVLDAARALRQRLDEQLLGGLAEWGGRVTQVVGTGFATPAGFESTPQGLVYRDAPRGGDGRVLVASARLPDVRTYRSARPHAALPRDEDAFGAYQELLERGDTTRLDALAADAEPGAAAAVERSRPGRVAGHAAPGDADAFALPGRGAATGPGGAVDSLRVRVVAGDLQFIRQPLLVGHYRSETLTGTEAAMDRLMGGEMKRALRARLYPTAVGTYQPFLNHFSPQDNPWQIPRPTAVVVVGLGEEGKLRPTDLVLTVSKGVIAWAHRLADTAGAVPATFELAATLVGSGGTGISPGESARAIAQGVAEANEVLARVGWPRVSELLLIELYIDRATEAWRGVHVLAEAAPARWALEPAVDARAGAVVRPLDTVYRGASYDLISAVTQRDEFWRPVVAFTLDTRRARTEIRAQSVQLPLLQELVLRASNDTNTDPQIGATLYHLLVPLEMQPFLGGSAELVLDLDPGTAAIPWELLDTPEGTRDGADATPWAIRTKLVRKLRTVEFRARVDDVRVTGGALVIGEPRCKDEYPRLAGARAEANAVVELLRGPRGQHVLDVTPLIAPDAPREAAPDAVQVTNALFARPWRILHVAGHGEPPELSEAPKRPGDPPQRVLSPRGVVLSNDTFLGPDEVSKLPMVPELVFLNTCYLAARAPGQLLSTGTLVDRARFAANVAEELIKIGVRCVVAAGWAVDDAAARTFATTFYEALLDGYRFMDAVAAARVRSREQHGGVTWAAYQCYGDPDWRLRRDEADAQAPTGGLAVGPATRRDETEGVISRVGLLHVLEATEVQARLAAGERVAEERERLRARLRTLQTRFGELWGAHGAVAEAFGHAWKEAGDRDEAMRWYERAMRAEDGTATLRAPEQLANLRVRAAWRAVERVRGEEEARAAALQARAEILTALERLETLVTMEATMERESLRGSAEKRLAMIARRLNEPEAELGHIDLMAEHYRKARERGEAQGLSDVYYPAGNCVAAEVTLHGGEAGFAERIAPELARARELLAARAQEEPDFWSVVGLTELRWMEAVAAGALAPALAGLAAEFEMHHARSTAPGNWASVHEQAEFVLGPYAMRAGADERAAVDELLGQLAEFAGLGARGGRR